jgi:hypothetical protein
MKKDKRCTNYCNLHFKCTNPGTCSECRWNYMGLKKAQIETRAINAPVEYYLREED